MGKEDEVKRIIATGTDLYDDFTAFANKHLEKDSANMMATVLVGHLYVERSLELLLKESLIDVDVLAKARFSFLQKVAVLESMGLLLPASLIYLKSLNELRNKFAHNLDYVIAYSMIEHFRIPKVTKNRWDKNPMGTMHYILAYVSGHTHGLALWIKDRKAKKDYKI
jgi:hypothetical protein